MNSVKNLDNLKIRRILKAHNVPCYIKGGRIYADTYEANRKCSFDYADEIHALKIANNRFGKILEIIDANEHEYILL